MAARQRSSVARTDCSESQMTYSRFLELFPDSDACLDYLKAKFYADGTDCPACGKVTKFHRVTGRQAYACQYCRHQVYPTSDTIFHKSSTSLQLWFWAIFLMSSTRCGISAKQLEREIGVSYPTAHRMFGNPNAPLRRQRRSVDGRRDGRGVLRRHLQGRQGPQGRDRKTTVFGMVERGGRVIAKTVADNSAMSLGFEYRKHVLPAATIFTDEWQGYSDVKRSYRAHHRTNHSTGVYVMGNVQIPDDRSFGPGGGEERHPRYTPRGFERLLQYYLTSTASGSIVGTAASPSSGRSSTASGSSVP